VKTDLDTLLTALHVPVDDHVIPSGGVGLAIPRSWRMLKMVCLAVVQVVLGARREPHWLRMCYPDRRDERRR
jgi:hypothetical protein